MYIYIYIHLRGYSIAAMVDGAVVHAPNNMSRTAAAGDSRAGSRRRLTALLPSLMNILRKVVCIARLQISYSLGLW